jgi:hypothetical protein
VTSTATSKRKGSLLPDADPFIAATAMAHDLTLETTDDHFQRLKQNGLKLIQIPMPWLRSRSLRGFLFFRFESPTSRKFSQNWNMNLRFLLLEEQGEHQRKRQSPKTHAKEQFYWEKIDNCQ